MKKKLKVLLLDLPAFNINLNDFRIRINHVPLAIGYLKAYADASGLADTVQIDIIPSVLMNLGGDSALVTYIIEKGCDLVGFSLYQWNALRSLHIMREVRRRRPETKFIAGGPEVNAETEYLLAEEALDFMVEGEGEEPFRKVLLSLLGDEPGFDGIAGLLYRKCGRFVGAASPEVLEDVAEIPSPYLEGVLDLGNYDYLFIETMRGCLFDCRYCSWKRGGRHGMSFFPAERIRRELQLAREKHMRFVLLADSGTNVSRKFLKKLCAVISAENRDHYFCVYTYLHPELIDEESAQWLKEANFRNPIIGLQTTNDVAMKAIGKKANLSAYIEGISHLKKYDVGFVSTIILGLPDDDLTGFSRTIDFLLEYKHDSVICFPLSVSPNTCFRAEAQSLGIKHQLMPPNLVISTPTMSFADIRKGIRLFREKFCSIGKGNFEKDLRYFRRANNAPGHSFHCKDVPSLAYYVHGKYPCTHKKKSLFKQLEAALPAADSFPLTRLILASECRSADEARTGKLAELLAPRLSWNSVIWLQDFGASHDIAFLKTLLASLSRDNLLHIWHIVL